MSHSGLIGGTMRGQHERTVEMLADMKNDDRAPLSRLLWFLYDSQTTYEDLKALAEIAQRRETQARYPWR